MELLKALKWRYATKKFISDKSVDESDLEKIKSAIQLSASSYGLQLYEVLVISDDDLRSKLKDASYNQPQITDASHLFVFCNYTEPKTEYVDEYMRNRAETIGKPYEEISSKGDHMRQHVRGMDAESFKNWTSRQVYIALGNLLAACAELYIDACPMEGFQNEKYNEILGLSEKGLNAAVIATIGYRSTDDGYADVPKVRKSKDHLFTHID